MLIGAFDSGIGGLTVLAALHDRLPGHELLYLGDTARVPYGTRSPRTVVLYALRVASYLHERGVSALVVACNTATSHALPALQLAAAKVNIPVFGVIEPGVRAALRVHRGGGIAVLGTAGTILGGEYQRRLASSAPKVTITAVPCPLFVPLAEEGWVNGEVPRQVAEHYLGHLRGRVDTAILGCTHYPLLAKTISEVLPGTRLVDSATATAEAVAEALGPGGQRRGEPRFLVTDHPERFREIGAHFLGWTPAPVEWVDLGPANAPFQGDA